MIRWFGATHFLLSVAAHAEVEPSDRVWTGLTPDPPMVILAVRPRCSWSSALPRLAVSTLATLAFALAVMAVFLFVDQRERDLAAVIRIALPCAISTAADPAARACLGSPVSF